MKQSVAGIAFHEGLFLIGLRIPGGEMGNRWEFPGGKVDLHESPEKALQREFLEELGVAITVKEHIASTKFKNKNNFFELNAYHIELDSKHIHTGPEHQIFKWASLEEIETLPFVNSDTALFPYLKQWIGT